VEEVLPSEVLPTRNEVGEWFEAESNRLAAQQLMKKALRDIRIKKVVKADEINNVHEAYSLIVQLREKMHNIEVMKTDYSQALQRLVSNESIDQFMELNEVARSRHSRLDYYGDDS